MTSPDSYPLLLLPTAIRADREPLPQARGGRQIRRPSVEEQGRRLTGKWAALQAAVEERRAELAGDLSGADPELVLVLEVAGRLDDFARAVRRIPGFEFLAEMDDDSLVGEDAVFGYEEAPDLAVPGTLYLLASNQGALAGVLDLWRMYQRDESEAFPYGQGKWKEVFRHLLDVRRWSAADRLRGTGAQEDFAYRSAIGQEVIPAELELWYRANAAARAAAEQRLRGAVVAVGGEILGSADISEIVYHALLVELPINAVAPLLEGSLEDVALLRVEDLAFVRPQAMLAVEGPEGQIAHEQVRQMTGRVEGEPLVGVLDGVPLGGHSLLRERLVVDDPDDLQSEAQAHARTHGTAVSSLVIHGDLGRPSRALQRPLYVRPVLVPETRFDGRTIERVPHGVLAIDLVHRAILRMREGVGGEPATAPSVCVVNLSLGDSTQPLIAAMSPWARLVDWLSHRFGIVFVISAGNYTRPLVLPLSPSQLAVIPPSDVCKFTVRAMVESAHERRLLSPSEAFNAITVGATHSDAGGAFVSGSRRDPLPDSPDGVEAFPSPITSLGSGYRRSIKPDLLTDGGRLLFHAAPASPDAPATVLSPGTSPSSVAPGLVVAAPGSGHSVNAENYLHGTSGAAALVTHHMGATLEYLEGLRDFAGEAIPDDLRAVLARALVIHAARIPQNSRAIRAVLAETVPAHSLRGAVSRFYGYGVLNPTNLLEGALSRVTLVGAGRLLPEAGDEYRIPLPPSLAGKVTPRRVTITAAAILPTRARDRRHRISEIYFIPPMAELAVHRVDSDYHGVRRGAVQHEVFEGESALTFVDGDDMAIRVSCRSLANAHREASLYGVAVTIEAPGSSLPIYAEVRSRVELAVQIRSRVRS